MPLDPAIAALVNRIVGFIGLTVGLIFFLGGGYVIHHHHLDEFIFRRAEAEGRVIENRRREPPASISSRVRAFTSYQAIVRFTDQRGEIVILPDEFAFINASFSVGQAVRIYYDPQDSRHAMIDRGPRNFIVPGICFGFGGLMILGSLQRLARAGAPPAQPNASQ
jgi:hypothetical protein